MLSKCLADSGYAGEPITSMARREVPALKPWGDITIDLLKRLDMKVDFAAVDPGTLSAPWKISAIAGHAEFLENN
jgi:peptide/nickel transport system substrate-binding protein